MTIHKNQIPSYQKAKCNIVGDLATHGKLILIDYKQDNVVTYTKDKISCQNNPAFNNDIVSDNTGLLSLLLIHYLLVLEKENKY